jgi:HEAT repeat protein
MATRAHVLIIGLIAGAAIAAGACWAAAPGADEKTQAPALTTPQLRALLMSTDANQVWFALYQLGARGEANDAQVRALCGHKDALVRRAAIFALGMSADAANKPLFDKALRDAEPGVRRAAVYALASLNDQAVVQVLAAALEDPHPLVRELTATALGRLGGERAVELLIGALDDTSARVRRAAVVALGALGDARAVDPLHALEKDPYAGTHRQAALDVGRRLDAGLNFDHGFLTLPDLAALFTTKTGVPTFVTDEALMAVALGVEDPDNLDGLKVAMWHVKARTFLDELTQAAGLIWIIEGRWVVITVPSYRDYDTPLELEIAGALFRLGEASAKAALQRYARDPQWEARATALLKKN